MRIVIDYEFKKKSLHVLHRIFLRMIYQQKRSNKSSRQIKTTRINAFKYCFIYKYEKNCYARE